MDNEAWRRYIATNKIKVFRNVKISRVSHINTRQVEAIASLHNTCASAG